MRHLIAQFDVVQKSAFGKLEIAFGAGRRLRASHGRLVSYVAGEHARAGAAEQTLPPNLPSRAPLVYCAGWLLVDGWFSSCCNCNNWRSCSTLPELDVGTPLALGC
jgi:hypothetical protein